MVGAHPVAGFEVHYARPDTLHDAAGLMSSDDVRGFATPVGAQVRAADAGGHHPNEHLAVLRLGHREVPDLTAAIT